MFFLNLRYMTLENVYLEPQDDMAAFHGRAH
jgi:hypothetical protein